jgi:hypothetical protein
VRQVLIRLLILAFISSHAVSAAATQRAEPLPTELAWVGLFNDELVGRLENANRLDDLCTAERASVAWHECRDAAMEPNVAVIPVRAAPSVSARRLGEIVLIGWPGTGLRAFASAGRLAAPFTPDLYDTDWGYGPYFHQTILGRRGSWFRIPVPSIGHGWINAEDWNEVLSTSNSEGYGIHTVRAGQILTTPRGDMFVLGVENRVLRVRPEQPSDLWCEGGDPPPQVPWQDIRIPFEQLFDSKGHLLIGYKHKRGC